MEPLLTKPRKDCVAVPQADNRDVLEGILWILRTGGAWKDLPSKYPSPSTCGDVCDYGGMRVFGSMYGANS
ncbi:transposase [Desulfosarcina alkanivorans]|uniref:transposase n=1 Tax=Desulfosarcina alkanivorans TaxID=571177 RepID=UPI0012D36F1C